MSSITYFFLNTLAYPKIELNFWKVGLIELSKKNYMFILISALYYVKTLTALDSKQLIMSQNILTDIILLKPLKLSATLWGSNRGLAGTQLGVLHGFWFCLCAGVQTRGLEPAFYPWTIFSGLAKSLIFHRSRCECKVLLIWIKK